MNYAAIINILPVCFEAKLSDHDKFELDHWRVSSEKKQKIFEESEKSWQELKILPNMKKNHSEKVQQNLRSAIDRLNKNIPTKIQKVVIPNEKAYFTVTENLKQRFIVKKGCMQIKITGTEFKTSNYAKSQIIDILNISAPTDSFKEERKTR